MRVLVVIALLSIGLAGCGSGGDAGVDKVASADGSGSTAAEPADTRSDEERVLAFAQCMREHGIDVPDPEPGGQGGIQVRVPEGMDKGKVDEANATCRAHLPNGGEPGKADPGMVEQARKMAQCMRENGVSEFPDPDENGGIRIEARKDGGINPESPEFKAAQQKCDQFLPKPADGAGPRQETRSEG
ncbi:hypothetical protein JOD54_003995 [Actinokineospora baliensis]|uniref:hypothetical protein n=1 Tax=Actinokineospora baliensis TaxID=547056 RepID=UPI0019567B48|nr:hypothetical protein [Actinokineospora baliensis]MBM7773791.1 hypothetical protein [Actinokineospora baliensis]